jgi:transposase-like protein
VVCEVACRRGLSPQQLFNWRAQLRDNWGSAEGLAFVIRLATSPLAQVGPIGWS